MTHQLQSLVRHCTTLAVVTLLPVQPLPVVTQIQLRLTLWWPLLALTTHTASVEEAECMFDGEFNNHASFQRLLRDFVLRYDFNENCIIYGV